MFNSRLAEYNFENHPVNKLTTELQKESFLF
jgi:hypothetical protein